MERKLVQQPVPAHCRVAETWAQLALLRGRLHVRLGLDLGSRTVWLHAPIQPLFRHL